MFIPQITFNDSLPFSNLFYVYLQNDQKVDKLSVLLHEHKPILIQLTTTVIDITVEGLILPKKYTENEM